MKTFNYSLTALAAMVLVSCDNPADATVDAQVSKAQEVASAGSSALVYSFTDDSKITFVGSKLTGSKSGGFKKTEGEFKLVDGKPVSGSFTIDMTSMYSENEKLTKHLKSEDFFKVEEFSVAKFEVTSFGATVGGTQTVSGNLTMLGVTNNISFPAQVTETDGVVKLSSKFDIKRHDWGIVYQGKPDDLIRNEVVIEFDLVAKMK